AADGTVALLRRLPRGLVPEPNQAQRYDPLALLRPGPIAPLRFLRFPFWMKRPADVLDACPGVIYGLGWGNLQGHDGTPGRTAADGAELFVNSLGQTQQQLFLEIEPPYAAPLLLQLRADDGQVVASAPVCGRQEVQLSFPVDPQRIGAYRLHLVAASEFCTNVPTGVPFHVYRPGGRVASARTS